MGRLGIDAPILLSSTAIVLSNDSPALVKWVARLAKVVYGGRIQICTGSNDDVQIQAAIDALPAGEGKVVLGVGTFDVEGSVTPSDGTVLEGQGDATHIRIYGVESDYSQIGGYPVFIPFESKTNIKVKNFNIQIMVDFPDYSVDDFFMIRMDNTTTHITFDGLHLVNKSDSKNGGYGIYGHSQHITIRNCFEEYCFRGFNSGQYAYDWLLENCKAHHTPMNVEWSISGFEFEDGSSAINCVNCEAYDIVEVTHGDRGRAFAFAGTHGPDECYGVRIVNPVVKDCQFAFDCQNGNANELINPYVDGAGYADSLFLYQYQAGGATGDLSVRGGVARNLNSEIYIASSEHYNLLIDGLEILDSEGANQVIRIDGGGHANRIILKNMKIIERTSATLHWGVRLDAVDGVEIDNLVVYDARALIADRTLTYAVRFNNTPLKNITIKDCIFRHLKTGVYDYLNRPSPNFVDSVKHSDLFMDVLAVSATHVRTNEDLSAGIPITFTIDAQPDVPRTLSGHFDSHANITAYTIEITGVDAKGNTVTEEKTEADGWDWETNNAFATITSIEMTARTGTGAGDTMDIGITDVLGLSNVIYETGDVFKIKKNNANAVVAGAQVDTDYDTYDMAVIGLINGDDFTIRYRSNLNIVV